MASTIHMRAEDGSILKLEYHESCPSVVELARSYANAGYPDRYVVVSEKQTKYDACLRPLKSGQGEVGVYISLILRPSMFHVPATHLPVFQRSFYSDASVLLHLYAQHPAKP